MIVAILALVVAASGTAVAASSLIQGDSLIKQGSLSGNRLRNHTITGTQVNMRKLGKVNSAKHADLASLATIASHANTAANATNATNAEKAGQANNAANLGGIPASAYAPATALHHKVVTLNTGQTGVVLVQQGAVSETADCTTTGAPQITGIVNQVSTVDNWLDFNTLKPTAGSSNLLSRSATTTAPAGSTNRIQVTAPNGDALSGQVLVEVNYPAAGQCTFVAFGVSG
jgi:hypothetical protein